MRSILWAAAGKLQEGYQTFSCGTGGGGKHSCLPKRIGNVCPSRRDLADAVASATIPLMSWIGVIGINAPRPLLCSSRRGLDQNMLAKLRTFSLLGIDALPVEVDVSPSGLPKTVLVGKNRPLGIMPQQADI